MTRSQYCKNDPMKAAILLFVIFILPGPSIQSTTISPAMHVCMLADGSMRCCTDYYQTPDGCRQCVGAYGVNCSLPCPSKYFGPSCASFCECGKDECDAKLGCSRDMKTTIFSSHSVALNNTKENVVQISPSTTWMLILSTVTAFVVVSVSMGCVIFFKFKAKKKTEM